MIDSTVCHASKSPASLLVGELGWNATGMSFNGKPKATARLDTPSPSACR